MKKFGLIGTPISGSLSPLMFKAAYPGSDMTYDLIETDNVEEALDIFRKEYDAVNVTAPFKESAFKAAERADSVCRRLGVTNLLMKRDGSIHASNTDYLAVANILRLHKVRFKDANVMVIGCGGAGKSAAIASSSLHLTTMVADRTVRKAGEFCFKHGGMAPLPFENIVQQVNLSNIGIIIYTLPVPVGWLEELPLNGKVVLEANYVTPCLEQICQEKGAIYVSGREWLLQQAIAGFTLMTGSAPNEQVLRDCLQKT